MPARLGFPSGVRGGVDALPWAAAGSGASVTAPSNAITSEPLRMCPPRRHRLRRLALQGSPVIRTLQSRKTAWPDQRSPRLRRSAEALAEAEGLHYVRSSEGPALHA